MYQFIDRNNVPRKEEINKMLNATGVKSMDELIGKIIPSNIRLNKPLNLDAPLSENAYLENIRTIASKNKIFRSFIGMGFYMATKNAFKRNIPGRITWICNTI
jgi:glycine dehydrogenase